MSSEEIPEINPQNNNAVFPNAPLGLPVLPKKLANGFIVVTGTVQSVSENKILQPTNPLEFWLNAIGLLFLISLIVYTIQNFKAVSNIFWFPIQNAIASTTFWLTVYLGNIILFVVFFLVIQRILRINILGKLIVFLLTSSYWLVKTTLKLFIFIPTLLFSKSSLNTSNQSQKEMIHVQTIVLINENRGKRIVVVFAAVHELMISQGDQLEGHGVAWRGRIRLKRVHNISTGQTWGWIL